MEVIHILLTKPRALKYPKYDQIRSRSTFSPSSHAQSWINPEKHSRSDQSAEMRGRRQVQGKPGPQENSLRPLQKTESGVYFKRKSEMSQFIWMTESTTWNNLSYKNRLLCLQNSLLKMKINLVNQGKEEGKWAGCPVTSIYWPTTWSPWSNIWVLS